MLSDYVNRFATLTAQAEMRKYEAGAGGAAVVVTSHTAPAGAATERNTDE